GNYEIGYVGGTYTVAKAAGKITPDPQTIVFGEHDPDFTYTVSGAGVGDLTTAPTCKVTGAHTNAGGYTIACSGAQSPNYTLDQTATAALTITKAPVVITPNNKGITYGDKDPVFDS